MRFSTCALAALVAFLSAPNSTQAEVIAVPREGSDFLLGRGFDSVTNEVKSDCIEYASIETLAVPGGGAGTLAFTEIRTREELRRALGISAAGSFGYGAFSGSAKVSYHQENRFDRQTYYLSATTEIVQQTETLRDVSLKPSAKTLLSTNPELFYQACGDTYVRARTVGGEFAALVKLDTSTEEEMTQLQAEFKASYQAASGSATMTQKSSELFEKHNGSVQFTRIGGVGAFPSTEPKAVRDYLSNFPTLVLGANSQPFPLSVTTAKYGDLLDAVNLSTVDITNSVRVMDELAGHYDRALDARDGLIYLDSNRDEFPDFDFTLLPQFDATITEVLNTIRNQANMCKDFPSDSSKCKFLPVEDVSIAGVEIPTRKEVVYVKMSSPNCERLGFEMVENPRTCRTASNGEEVVERHNARFYYSPSYDEGIARNRVIGNFQQLEPLYGSLCNKSERNLSSVDLQAIFNKDPSVWGVESSKMVGTYRILATLTNPQPAPPDSLIDKNHPLAVIYPSSRFTNTGQLRANQWGTLLECQATLVRKQYIEAPSPDCGVDLVQNLDAPIYDECRHPDHGIEGFN